LQVIHHRPLDIRRQWDLYTLLEISLIRSRSLKKGLFITTFSIAGSIKEWALVGKSVLVQMANSFLLQEKIEVLST
jgi:hypothetical protein